MGFPVGSVGGGGEHVEAGEQGGGVADALGRVFGESCGGDGADRFGEFFQRRRGREVLVQQGADGGAGEHRAGR